MWYSQAKIEKFPSTQYFREITVKRQIVLHHTVSPSNSVKGDLNWWLSSPERVGTHFIIDYAGNVTQIIDTNYWIHHLYVNFVGNRVKPLFKTKRWNDGLNKGAIGIELDSAGGLTRDSLGNWRASYGSPQAILSQDKVITYPKAFRGYFGFERYYPEQLQSLDKLLQFLGEVHSIPLIWDSKNFDVSERALSGEPGLYTHVSYRSDKSDCHPDPGLISLLKKYEHISS